MDKLIEAIRHNDSQSVEAILIDNPRLLNISSDTLVSCDEAILKTALDYEHFDIARLILDRKTDLNYCVLGPIKNWEQPVFHTIITSTLQHARYPRPQIDGPKNSGVSFQSFCDIMQTMIDKGVDIHQTDSYGNTPLMRAVLDVLNIGIDIVDEDFEEDMRTLFQILMDAGCDIHKATSTRQSVWEMFKSHKVMNYILEP